jgi:ABC-type multidrug transport system ATPase subunit
VTINVEGLGKKFGNEWIFRHLDRDFRAGERYAITGHNGSGKSTLLKILAGNLPATTGKLHFSLGDRAMAEDEVFRHLAYAAPYLDLIEELTLAEAIAFHQKFKPLRVSARELLTSLGYVRMADRPLKQFSSGMKQKVKLGLALYSDCSALLLDEPTANFDQANTEWYLDEIKKAPHRLIIICSNQAHEYAGCGETLNLADLKN